MSIWLVSNTHVDAMLTAALVLIPRTRQPIRWDREHDSNRWDAELTRANVNQVGAMLLAENQRSVNHRYGENEIEPVYTYNQLPGRPDPVTVLKTISCYEYQSDGSPSWHTSEARRFCQILREMVIFQLPGYDAAPWGINQRDVFLAPHAARQNL